MKREVNIREQRVKRRMESSPASASSFSLIFFKIASNTDRSISTLMSESCTRTPRTDTPPKDHSITCVEVGLDYVRC